jgi:hypothetical protein
MTLDRRQFLKSSLSGAAAFACWVKVPTLAHAKARAELIRMAERPPNYESVRSTFTTRITPVERFYLRNHFDLPKIDVPKWRLRVHLFRASSGAVKPWTTRNGWGLSILGDAGRSGRSRSRRAGEADDGAQREVVARRAWYVRELKGGKPER